MAPSSNSMNSWATRWPPVLPLGQRHAPLAPPPKPCPPTPSAPGQSGQQATYGRAGGREMPQRNNLDHVILPDRRAPHHGTISTGLCSNTPCQVPRSSFTAFRGQSGSYSHLKWDLTSCNNKDRRALRLNEVGGFRTAEMTGGGRPNETSPSRFTQSGNRLSSPGLRAGQKASKSRNSKVSNRNEA